MELLEIVCTRARVSGLYTVTLLVPRFVTYRLPNAKVRRVGALMSCVMVLSIAPVDGFNSSTWFAPLFATHRLPAVSNMMPLGLLSCALAVIARLNPRATAQQRPITRFVVVRFMVVSFSAHCVPIFELVGLITPFPVLNSNGVKR